MSEFKKEKIGFEELGGVAGGEQIDVKPEMLCRKSGKFMVLESKRDEWESQGCPKKCKYCWRLKYGFQGGGLICDA